MSSTRGAGAGALVGTSSSFWYSKNLMVWGWLSSVMVKSFAVRPSIGLPSLPLTVTVSITSVAPVMKVGVAAPDWTLVPTCCDQAASVNERKAERVRRIVLEPHSQGGLHAPHRVGRGGQPELIVSDLRDPTGEDHMVERVVGVDAQIEAEAIVHAERALNRGVQAELGRPCDAVSSCVAPLALRGRGEGGGI